MSDREVWWPEAIMEVYGVSPPPPQVGRRILCTEIEAGPGFAPEVWIWACHDTNGAFLTLATSNASASAWVVGQIMKESHSAEAAVWDRPVPDSWTESAAMTTKQFERLWAEAQAMDIVQPQSPPPEQVGPDLARLEFYDGPTTRCFIGKGANLEIEQFSSKYRGRNYSVIMAGNFLLRAAQSLLGKPGSLEAIQRAQANIDYLLQAEDIRDREGRE